MRHLLITATGLNCILLNFVSANHGTSGCAGYSAEALAETRIVEWNVLEDGVIVKED